MRCVCVLVLVLAVVLPAAAADLASNDILIPVVARTPGALGTDWATDVVITNLSDRLAADIAAAFYYGGETLRFAETLKPGQSLVFADIIKTRFGLEQAAGFIRITSADITARIAARARVFNRGRAEGEYGQGITAVPTDALSRRHELIGVSGVDGNRTNAGVVNPWSIPVTANFGLVSKDGEPLGNALVDVPARTLVQVNEVFSALFPAAQPADATISVGCSLACAAYATVVRNDTGDSTFIAGTGLTTGNERLFPVQCSNPAPVALTPPGAIERSEWIVQYFDDVDSVRETAILARKHDFIPGAVYEFALNGFDAFLTDYQVAQIRCEPTVRYIEQNSQFGGRP